MGAIRLAGIHGKFPLWQPPLEEAKPSQASIVGYTLV